jgi:hypothetical protein
MLVEHVGKMSDIHDDDHTCQPTTKRMHVNTASVVEFVWLLKEHVVGHQFHNKEAELSV